MNFLKSKPHLIILGGILLLTVLLLAGTSFINKKSEQPKKAYVEEVVVVPTSYTKIPQPKSDTSSWKTFSDKNLKLTLKYPPDVMIDPRQTSENRITVFIFDEDKTASLPGKVTALYIADTHKSFTDGFSAFRKSDCSKECEISYKNTEWININNVYGVKNPLPDDVHNYYLTDKNMTGSVVNVYVGGYISQDKVVLDKIKVFEEMIKTIQFER
jgi:hypothetical protein